MAASYAGLLAEKLEKRGERAQALLIRERLGRAPQAVATAQDAARGFSGGSLPIDGESRLHTVDVSYPSAEGIYLSLPSATQVRIDEFLQSVEFRDELVRAGASVPNRMLIYGPPGTGKTQTARWIAAALKLPLLTVRCDTLVNSLLGQTSKNLRRVFEHAEQRPCILFLDEFDAVAGARGNERDVGELQRVVISLLQNMDALDEGTILIASTNHDSALDPAVWRRFGFRVPMPLPDEELRAELWRSMIGAFASENLHLPLLAAASAGASGALIEQVCLDAKRTAVLKFRSKSIDETELFRRLGLALALQSGRALPSIGDEVRWLRQWDKQRFSLRELSRLYELSTRQINNFLKEEEGKHGDASEAFQFGR